MVDGAASVVVGSGVLIDEAPVLALTDEVELKLSGVEICGNDVGVGFIS